MPTRKNYCMGARRVIFVDKAYHKERHRPYSANEGAMYGAPVGFIGTYERQRAESMLHLQKTVSQFVYGGIIGPDLGILSIRTLK